MTWTQWHEWFSALYGAGGWMDASVAVWIQDVLIPGGTTPEEMKAVALAVARSGAPPKPHEILSAMLAELKRVRAAAILARDEQARFGGGQVGPDGCATCDGSGWAIVPHCPQPERALEKGFLATCAVTCSCHHGRRMTATNQRGEGAMSLAAYEVQNPRWREQMARERARQRAEWMAEGETSELGRLVGRLCRKR